MLPRCCPAYCRGCLDSVREQRAANLATAWCNAGQSSMFLWHAAPQAQTIGCHISGLHCGLRRLPCDLASQTLQIMHNLE